MLRGFDNRHTGATKANSRSSRSHTVIQVHMECLDTSNQNMSFSMMNLIDLAGAEKQKHTGATGDRLLEAQNINRSLSVLGSVMEKIVLSYSKKNTHIPFRDSKLTFLLQDALSGKCVTTLNCNMSARVD